MSIKYSMTEILLSACLAIKDYNYKSIFWNRHVKKIVKRAKRDLYAYLYDRRGSYSVDDIMDLALLIHTAEINLDVDLELPEYIKSSFTKNEFSETTYPMTGSILYEDFADWITISFKAIQYGKDNPQNEIKVEYSYLERFDSRKYYDYNSFKTKSKSGPIIDSNFDRSLGLGVSCTKEVLDCIFYIVIESVLESIRKRYLK